MQITIDLLSHLRNMKQQFQSKDRWVSEFVQNAQRSKATELRVVVADDKVTVSDNGCGCEDPKTLFTIATTGWTGLKDETPFGTGFFSTLAAAKRVTVRSRDWCAAMNIEEIFNEGTLDVVRVAHGLPDFRGFETTLYGVDTQDVEAQFSHECKFLPFDLRVNGALAAKDTFAKAPDLPEYAQMRLDNEWFTGRIWAQRFGSVDTYHQYRHVEDLYVRANGHVEFKLAHPRCPDRTAWLRDDEYTNTRRYLIAAISQMYHNVWKLGSEELIVEHSDAICQEVPLQDLLNEHSFLAHNSPQDAVGIPSDKLVDFKGFWASTKTDANIVKRAWHYAVSVILSQNPVEDFLLEGSDIPRVETFDKELKRHAEIKVSNSRPDVLRLFKRLADIAGVSNRLLLADIQLWLQPSRGGERKEMLVSGLCSDGTAYVQASVCDNKTTSEALAATIITAAHEVAHLFGPDDGDPKHMEIQLSLLEKWMPAVIVMLKENREGVAACPST